MKYSCLLFAALLPLTLHAKPSADEVNKVVDFYNNGKEQGIVLSEIKLCEGIGKDGTAKNECEGEINPASLKAGQSVTVWMNFMVPMGLQEQEIMLQFNHQGVTRVVEKVTVANAMRYRVWRKVKFDRAGDWNANVIHDNGQTSEVLRELKLTVQAK